MKSRKIYYVPGMISLICLPILCIWYLNDNKIIERCIILISPQRYVPNQVYENNLRFDTTVLSQPEYKRKYIEFKLNGDIINDKNTLNSFNSKLIKIIEDKDTITGLHINIKDNTKYLSMIKVIDICRTDSFSSCYLFYDNDFFYLHKEVSDSIKQIIRSRKNSINNNYFESDVVYVIPTKTITAKFKETTNTLKLIECGTLFIIYIVFSILSISYIKNKYIKTNKLKI